MSRPADATKQITCPECDGTGKAERERVIEGIDANGPYKVYWPFYILCDNCDGDGEVEE